MRLAERHGLDLIVRDVDGRGGETLMQLLEVGAELGPQLCVQVRERLVEEVDARPAGERAPHRHALPLAAGELGGLAVQQLIEVRSELTSLTRSAISAVGILCCRSPKARFCQDGLVRIQRVALEHHRDVAVPGRDAVHDLSADGDRSRGRLLQPRDHPEGGRLPAAGRPDQDHELAVGDACR